ncbi:TPA: hypothetical protein ACFBXO_002151, partial [Neisseria gonorrhoeae]
DSRPRGNDGGAVSVAPDKFLKLKISSFPQDSHHSHKIPTRTENQKQKPKIRHSRESGNPVR